MNSFSNYRREAKHQAASLQSESGHIKREKTFALEDNRPRSVYQRKMHEGLNNSHGPLSETVNSSPYLTDNRVQNQRIVQMYGTGGLSTHRPPSVQFKENKTGLDESLKSGIEKLSGVSLNDVRTHYNSNKPAQLNAHAYAQGTDIHLAPGQEKHLPHEAWHVVQQKQGRVQPTFQMKQGVAVNDDRQLEKEADDMGAKALSMNFAKAASIGSDNVRQLKGFGAHRHSSLVSHSAYSKNVFQFALPPAKWDTKGLYNATTGKNIPYKGGRPVKFATPFKHRLLNTWQKDGSFGIMTSKNGNKEYIRTPSTKSAIFANWVPLEAFQIDHKRPWAKIEKDLLTPSMVTKMKTQNDAGLINNKTEPSFYGAKMYYHDYTNLQPMQGSENAGKGATTSKIPDVTINKDQFKVEQLVTRKYLSIMDSIQNAYAKGDQQVLTKIKQDWLGSKGRGRGLLNEAETLANSKATNAPTTPMKKTTVINVSTPKGY